MGKKTHQDHLPVWMLNLIRKSYKRYFLVIGLGFWGLTSFLALFGAALEYFPSQARIAVMMTSAIGLLLILLLNMRWRYWRDIMAYMLVFLCIGVVELFIVGFTTIFIGSDFLTFALALMGTLASMFFVIRTAQNQAACWNLAQSGVDLEKWVFDDDFSKIDRKRFDIMHENTKSTNRARWLGRLSKLHYLMPGIMVSLRRAFGHGETISGVLAISLGLLFASIGMYILFAYLKIREWEREKGKPILLRSAWEKEQQQQR